MIEYSRRRQKRGRQHNVSRGGRALCPRILRAINENREGMTVKAALVFGLVAFATCAQAQMPRQITKHVSSGKTTTVAIYNPANRSCENAQGTVTLASKPKHGVVANRLERTTFGGQYRRTRHCYGKPTLGFVITYTSTTGFRGVDHFILELRLPRIGVHRLDGYSIIVE